MSDSYFSVEEFKNSAELIGVSFADADGRRAVDAAKSAIDQYCGRSFTVGTATETRYYTPTSWSRVEIDDVTSIGTLATDHDGDGVFETTWTLNTDYNLLPLNAAAKDWPYNEITPRPTSGLRFVPWPRSVAVTGVFGWPEVPAPIREVASILVPRFVRRTREAPFGVVGLGYDGQAIRITRTDPDLCFLLDPYVSGQAGVFIA